MIVAFSGIRDIAPESERDLNEAVWRIAFDPTTTEMRFGGARGSDTLALRAASRFAGKGPLLRVVVPGRLIDQPRDTIRITQVYAHEIIEMGLQINSWAYRARNTVLVTGADLLVAFWDERPGGTAMTINLARERGVPVRVVPVKRATSTVKE